MHTQDPKADAIVRQLQGCNSHSKLLKIHAISLTSGLILRHPSILTSLLAFSAASSAGSLSHALLLFRHHIPFPPLPLHWNLLIRGLSSSHHPRQAILCYNAMLGSVSSHPDQYSLSFALRACERFGSVQKCLEVHASAVRRGLAGDVLVGTNLVRAYAGVGFIGLARKLFEEMPMKDLVAWNAMVSCYAQKGFHCEALEVYGRMREAGMRPDGFTVVAVLSSCTSVGALGAGVEAHRVACERGLLRSVYVGNALIDMYAKCGELEAAVEVFEGMKSRDVLSWNSVIVGFGVHGRGDKAIEFFERMRVGRIEPNSVTFLGLLCGCSHQGLVNEGVKYFDLMSSKYNIKPGIKHYGCFVDLLGRAGRLEAALKVIKTCPQKDPVLWRTLLGSCKIHRNVEIGETALRNLVQLGASNAGDCVLLAAIYRGANDTNGVVRMRRMIKTQGIRTSPGWSWIEVDGQVHRFVVDDTSHPCIDEIYTKLKQVIHELSLIGYVDEEEYSLS